MRISASSWPLTGHDGEVERELVGGETGRFEGEPVVGGVSVKALVLRCDVEVTSTRHRHIYPGERVCLVNADTTQACSLAATS